MRRRGVLCGGASFSGECLFGGASTVGEANVSGARRGLPGVRGEGGSR